jgi:hypothetical protein
MLDDIETAGRAVTHGFHVALRRVSFALTARICVVVAAGVAAVNLLDRLGPWFVTRGAGDATAFVMGQLKVLTRASIGLATMTHDALVFLGLS